MLNGLALLAQTVTATPVETSTGMKALYFLGVLIGCFVVPFYLGRMIARSVRLPDHGWKVGLVLCSVLLSAFVVYGSYDRATGKFNIPQGVDLKGGAILIYEIDEAATEAAAGEEAGPTRDMMGALVEALARRINPSGTKEIVIRPYGDQQVEIIIPEVDPKEVETIKKQISTAGVLEFRIVANVRDHADDVIEAARRMAEDPGRKRGLFVKNAAGERIGLWATVGRDAIEKGNAFAVIVAGDTVRDATTGEILDLSGLRLTAEDQDERRKEFTQQVEQMGYTELDVLMAINDTYNVTGGHLKGVQKSTDEYMNPCIKFDLKSAGGGVQRFAGLTTEFGPESGFNRQLGIVLDNTLLSAPNIQEPITGGQGRITGQFTPEQVEFLVNILDAGRLPAILNPDPISESEINPLLGAETIKQGKFAITISLSIVLFFIAIFYRFSGIVACTALLLNLLFILALMILIKAAFTLPGLAGLVLTVGMSVDANVLIFERIREELTRGAALRMAIRNGFARATTTIVDANVTTLITAVVLYAIGTDQIRGFAVTLILGILMSMYTAIFCARIAFDFAERAKWLTQLNMMRILSATQIDFVGKRRLAGVFSVLIIVVGIVGIASRKSGMLDIDFNGGTSVQMSLEGSMPTEEVRDRISNQLANATDETGKPVKVNLTVTALKDTDATATNTNFKVDTSLKEVRQLEDAIKLAFADSQTKLATYSLEFGELHEVALRTPRTPVTEETPDQPGTSDKGGAAEPPAGEESPAAEKTPPATEEKPETSEETAPASEEPAAKGDEDASTSEPESAPEKDDASEGAAAPTSDDQGAADLASDELLAFADDARELLLAQADAASDADAQPEAPVDSTADQAEPAAEPADPPAEPTPEETTPDAPSEPAPADATDSEAATITESDAETAAVSSTQFEVDLTLKRPINAQTLQSEIEAAAEEENIAIPYLVLHNPEWDGSSSNAFTTWKLTITADESQARTILEHLEADFATTPVWAASSKIGSQVAGDMQQKAIAALVASLFGIVVYIWIRFQRVVFGLAAVVALLHDVLVTLGAIAVSAWFADALGFLLIEEFKISLPIVAALLTIIGYSLNDTIVVFDRIREVRGKSPDLTGDMINRSINQTLSRTMLTSLTTLLVVVILYAMGGSGIHGFAFSLVVGVAIGTYSSIFVASPVLLLMAGANKPSKASATA